VSSSIGEYELGLHGLDIQYYSAAAAAAAAAAGDSQGAGIGSDLLVVSYCVRTSVGLVTLAKCMHSNEKCSFVKLRKVCVMEKCPQTFCKHYPPCKSTVYRIVEKIGTTDPVVDKNKMQVCLG